MRMRSATRSRSALLHALLAVLTLIALASDASAQSETAQPGDGSTTTDGIGFGTADAPELIAVGHGRGAGRCFVEVHVDTIWPPPPQVQRWVLQIVVQDATGATTIRSFASHDLDIEDTVGSNAQRRLRVDEIDVADDVVAFRWGCGAAPTTVDVRFEVNDRDGRTLLVDVVETHAFVDAVRAAGEVPEAELVQDEVGDLLSPSEGGGGATPPLPPKLGGGTSTTGGLLIVALVLTMGFFGYLVWREPEDSGVD